MDPLVGVVVEEEVDEGGAEQADAVEEQDHLGLVRRGRRRRQAARAGGPRAAADGEGGERGARVALRKGARAAPPLRRAAAAPRARAQARPAAADQLRLHAARQRHRDGAQQPQGGGAASPGHGGAPPRRARLGDGGAGARGHGRPDRLLPRREAALVAHSPPRLPRRAARPPHSPAAHPASGGLRLRLPRDRAAHQAGQVRARAQRRRGRPRQRGRLLVRDASRRGRRRLLGAPRRPAGRRGAARARAGAPVPRACAGAGGRPAAAARVAQPHPLPVLARGGRREARAAAAAAARPRPPVAAPAAAGREPQPHHGCGAAQGPLPAARLEARPRAARQRRHRHAVGGGGAGAARRRRLCRGVRKVVHAPRGRRADRAQQLGRRAHLLPAKGLPQPQGARGHASQGGRAAARVPRHGPPLRGDPPLPSAPARLLHRRARRHPPRGGRRQGHARRDAQRGGARRGHDHVGRVPLVQGDEAGAPQGGGVHAAHRGVRHLRLRLHVLRRRAAGREPRDRHLEGRDRVGARRLVRPHPRRGHRRLHLALRPARAGPLLRAGPRLPAARRDARPARRNAAAARRAQLARDDVHHRGGQAHAQGRRLRAAAAHALRPALGGRARQPGRPVEEDHPGAGRGAKGLGQPAGGRHALCRAVGRLWHRHGRGRAVRPHLSQ
mmetsp:Transcript_40012/g.123213  ORF Transcript_40012/g.123213 Transcript_40012/m.123213 type:complete len:670 (+) Transcript_40012:630-2639(+)